MLFLLGHVLGLLAQSCGIYSKSTTVFLISALRALWSASLFFCGALRESGLGKGFFHGDTTHAKRIGIIEEKSIRNRSFEAGRMTPEDFTDEFNADAVPGI